MAPKTIRLNHLLPVTALVVAIEIVARFAAAANVAPVLLCTGLARAVMIAAIFSIAKKLPRGPASIGVVRSDIFSGIKKGLLWSAGFGALALLGFAGCTLLGVNPLGLVSVSIPGSPVWILTYFLVGAALAPVAEEVYFRGFIFGWLRSRGPVAAVIGSTLIFVAVHFNIQPIPFAQLIGGLVFAISYEIEKNLIVPIVIHALGNAALFSLSLLA
jgi:membrane protease YdiL (CAAX protease family)